MPQHVSLRDQLKSKVSDFLEDAAMTDHATEEALIALAVDLADYREEGVRLFPRVLFCDDLDDTLRLLQGSPSVAIGEGPAGAETVRKCLKRCAPLASNGWLIWLERQGTTFRFGVFRAPYSPTAIDIRSTLADLTPADVRAFLASQLAPGSVEIVGPGLDSILVHLSGSRVESLPAAAQQDQLASWFMQDADAGPMQEPCQSFATSLFGNLLRECHGTLIAFVDASKPIPPGLSEDGILLEAPIDLVSLVVRHAELDNTESYCDLVGAASLLGGMINSDGILLLSTSGRVLGYNVFVRPETDTLLPSELVGGARRRAFHVLRSMVDGGAVRGAYIRSSDGGSSFHGEVA